MTTLSQSDDPALQAPVLRRATPADAETLARIGAVTLAAPKMEPVEA
jgi:hypothetical protein